MADQIVAQPSISYMIRLAGLNKDLKDKDRMLIFLRNTNGHPWCNDFLRKFDKSLVKEITDEEYASSLRSFLTELALVFQKCAWFTREKDEFRVAFINSWENVTKTFRPLY
jgi:hypothetical protein